MLHISFALCLFVGFALLFGQTGFFFRFSFTLDAISFFLRFAFFFCDGVLLLAFCTVSVFFALTLGGISAGFLFCFTARCGFNLRFVLRLCISAGLLCRLLLHPLVTLALSLFRQAALLFAFTVKLVIHQQSHFVVCFELNSPL